MPKPWPTWQQRQAGGVQGWDNTSTQQRRTADGYCGGAETFSRFVQNKWLQVNGFIYSACCYSSLWSAVWAAGEPLFRWEQSIWTEDAHHRRETDSVPPRKLHHGSSCGRSNRQEMTPKHNVLEPTIKKYSRTSCCSHPAVCAGAPGSFKPQISFYKKDNKELRNHYW